MKITSIYSVIMIFLIFNVHLVELSEKTKRHKSRFYITKNESKSKSNSKESTFYGVSQFTPINTYKSRLSTIYNSVVDSNLYKYTMGGILFLLEIFV